MQIAILGVLIFIAVLMAGPWLLGMLLIIAATYGVWLVACAALSVCILRAVLAWMLLSGQTESSRARRIAKIAERSNKNYREKIK